MALGGTNLFIRQNQSRDWHTKRLICHQHYLDRNWLTQLGLNRCELTIYNGYLSWSQRNSKTDYTSIPQLKGLLYNDNRPHVDDSPKLQVVMQKWYIKYKPLTTLAQLFTTQDDFYSGFLGCSESMQQLSNSVISLRVKNIIYRPVNEWNKFG